MMNIILIGAGGHCRSCIDVIEHQGQYKIIGLVDANMKVGESVFGYKILGNDDDLKDLIKTCSNFLVTIGQIKNALPRINVFETIKKLGGEFPVIISPQAYVSARAKISEGSIIMHGAMVNAGCVIGKNCIINSKALCEHDVVVHDHCHISTGAILNGDCVIGAKAFIGSNTVLKQGSKIEEGTIVPYGIKI
jgi:sugar O-acyltransferase (sialic acid O-acetyltransferase NeuD family)